MRTLSTTVILGLVAAACSAPPSLHEKQPASTSSAIVYGGPDTTDTAVMYLLNTRMPLQCSATLIAVHGAWGYVLSAAHCFEGGWPAYTFTLKQGDDIQTPTATYTLDDYKVLPFERGRVWTSDFAIARFAVTKNTPVPIAPLTPERDLLDSQTPVTIAGYGSYWVDSNEEGFIRYSATNVLTNVTSNYIEYVDSRDTNQGGACEGDSGGPVLVTIGGTKYVAGVSASGNCGYTGAAGRVSSVYASFIQPYLAQVVTTGCDEPHPTTKCSAGWRCCGAIDGWSCGVCE